MRYLLFVLPLMFLFLGDTSASISYYELNNSNQVSIKKPPKPDFNISKSFPFNKAKAMKRFVKEQQTYLHSLGWKHANLKINIQRDEFYVTVSGSDIMDEYWEQCDNKVWTAQYATPSLQLSQAAQAAKDFYYNEGYNCVCRVQYIRNGFDGEWQWWQVCITVTATYNYECPCDLGLKK